MNIWYEQMIHNMIGRDKKFLEDTDIIISEIISNDIQNKRLIRGLDTAIITRYLGSIIDNRGRVLWGVTKGYLIFIDGGHVISDASSLEWMTFISMEI